MADELQRKNKCKRLKIIGGASLLIIGGISVYKYWLSSKNENESTSTADASSIDDLRNDVNASIVNDLVEPASKQNVTHNIDTNDDNENKINDDFIQNDIEDNVTFANLSGSNEKKNDSVATADENDCIVSENTHNKQDLNQNNDSPSNTDDHDEEEKNQQKFALSVTDNVHDEYEKIHFENNKTTLIFGFIRTIKIEFFCFDVNSQLFADIILNYIGVKICAYGIGFNMMYKLGFKCHLKRYTKLKNINEIISESTSVSFHSLGNCFMIKNNDTKKIYVAGNKEALNPNYRKIRHDKFEWNEFENLDELIDGINNDKKDQFISIITDSYHNIHKNIIITNAAECYGDFDEKYSQQLKEIMIHHKIKKVGGGKRFTIILTDDGQLFGSGSNEFGQIGLGNVKYSDYPKQIKISNVTDKNEEIIKDFSCGSDYTIALNKNDDMVTFGNNLYAQLCLPGKYKKQLVAIPNILFDEQNQNKLNIKTIFCGGSHSLIITEKNICYLFGNNGNGQVGIGRDKETHCFTPQRFQISTVKMGQCGSFYSLILTSFGKIYGFGSNGHNQISSRNMSRTIYSPYHVSKEEIGISQRETIVNIVIGGSSTIILTEQ